VSGDSDAPTARLAGTVAGREATRLLAGEESVVLGGVVEVPHAQRRVLPVPNCDCEGEHDRELPRGSVERTVEESLERAERALDPRVGPVTEVGEAESFPVPYYLATLSDTTGVSDAAAASNAAGVSTDWNAAFMKALGEGLERYCAGVYRESEFRRASADALDAAVPPSSFVLHPSYGDPDPGESIRWVRGEDLHDGVAAWLPAEFVTFPPPERRHRPAITTGLGLGNGGAGALLSGLYEVVERDAAMLSWYSTFDPLGLAVDDDGFDELVGRARAVNLDVSVVLVTADVDVPVVAAAVRRQEWPRFAAGSSASLDAAAAARGALAEALQNWMELRGMGPDEAAEEGAVGDFGMDPGPAASFFDPETTVPAGSVGPDDQPTGGAELAAVLERVADAGLDAYAARLTTRDVEALGFEAVRVLVPRAQPLFTGESYFGERAREVPASLGYEPRLDREFHPFP
jgi:ribosomal protein S12 methylthiotransferase accessory factor